MTTNTTATAYQITYRKVDSRYYVDLDGVQVGWVVKADKSEWTFYATVRESTKGERLGIESQRQSAVQEGLSTLRIRHFGRVFRLELDRNSESFMDDVPVYFKYERLEATWRQMLDDRFGI